MISELLLLAGPPAAGKSTIARALTDTLAYSVEKKPFAHTIFYDAEGDAFGAELGWRPEYGPGANFGGTDRLAFDVIEKVAKWLKVHPMPFLLAEGDRLTNGRFIDSAHAAGVRVEIAIIDADQKVLARRRLNREQHEGWARGRETKVRSFARVYDPFIIATLDGADTIENSLAKLAEHSRVAAKFLNAR